jgi:hypothetical protein
MGMEIALLQMMVTADKEANLKRAEALVKKAAQGGADMAVLPEMFNCPYDNAYFREYAEPKGGETYRRLSEMAKENAIYVVGGSIPQIKENRIYNTLTFNRQGNESTTTAKPTYSIPSRWRQAFRNRYADSRDNACFQTEFGLFGWYLFDIVSRDWRASKTGLLSALCGAFKMTTCLANGNCCPSARSRQPAVHGW